MEVEQKPLPGDGCAGAFPFLPIAASKCRGGIGTDHFPIQQVGVGADGLAGITQVNLRALAQPAFQTVQAELRGAQRLDDTALPVHQDQATETKQQIACRQGQPSEQIAAIWPEVRDEATEVFAGLDPVNQLLQGCG